MKSMREMIKLMEGVQAVPGIGGSESDMQTAGTVGRDQAYASFNASQPNVTEKAPPGMEKTVKDIKKEYPGHEEKAFATAWSIYNRKHGQASEEVEIDEEQVEEAHVDTCRQSNPKAARYACAMEEDFDLNNGYGDEKYADGDDYFPNGADSPVVKKVGPSGARQGDNPEQKKMQIAELHTELVYGYRKYLKESKK